MEIKLGLYWGIFIFSIMPWLSGLYAQKVNNSQKSSAYRMKSKRSWVWLLGLKPGKEYIYVAPAIFQIWAIITLVTGFISVYYWGDYGFKIVIYVIYLGGIMVMTLLGGILIITKR